MKSRTRNTIKGLGITVIWIMAVVATAPLFAWNWLSFSYMMTGLRDSDPANELVYVFAIWEGVMFSDRPHRVAVLFPGTDEGGFRYFPENNELETWVKGVSWRVKGEALGPLSETVVLERVLLAQPDVEEAIAERYARDIIQMIKRSERHDYSGIDYNDLYDRFYTDAPTPDGWEQLWVWGGGQKAAIRTALGPSLLMPFVPFLLALATTLYLARSRPDQPQRAPAQTQVQ